LIVWVIAGLLGVATGLRIGWALVNKQSIVSAAMMMALGSLGVLAALNWQPLTVLLDAALNWPNVSIALSQVALIICAVSSCVMITTASSTRTPIISRRLAWVQYTIAVVIAAISLVLFFRGGRQPEMSPQDYLRENLESRTSLPWLLPLLFVLFALTVVAVAGVRYSSQSRRGRALFVFTIGIALIVVGSGLILVRAVGSTEFVGVGAAVTLIAFAMLIVAAGALLPTIEDWFGALLELRTIDPLLRELGHRQPNVGIGVRPHGPLTFRVAERMSLISDALFLEATKKTHDQAGEQERFAIGSDEPDAARVMARMDPPRVSPQDQAHAVAEWVLHTRERNQARFPGLNWLRQPDDYSDREWILAIAHQYRQLIAEEERRSHAARDSVAVRTRDARAG
jgi:hypothetical protein